jgi:glycosyltransferase involved in cell wall biosynthesis
VHNGVDLPPAPAPIPTGAPFTVLSIGRATFQRRPDWVARVARRVRRELDSRFVWIGDGPYREALLAAGVVVEGWLEPEHARARLGDAHVVLHLAAFEGLPLAVLEAMAAGRAVVATDLPPLREAVGDAGILVRDEAGAAAAVSALAGDEGLRNRLGERARDRIRRLFSRQTMIERTFAAYGLPTLPASLNGVARHRSGS